MAKKKFYAVKQGRKTGMFLTWDDCKKQVMGYPGAIYKSFGTEKRQKRIWELREHRQIRRIEKQELPDQSHQETINQKIQKTQWRSMWMEATMLLRKNFLMGW